MPWTLAKCVATGHNNSMNVTIALKRSRVAVWLFLSAALAAGPLSAGVVVVQNWTSVKIAFAASGGDGQATRYTVAPSDIAAIPADGPVAITVGEGAAAVPQQVPINSIIYFVVKDGILHFQRLVLPGVEDKSDGGAKQTATVQPPAAGPKPKSEPAPIYKIPVAILVDTADVRSRANWEKKLRKRLDDCSDIFEHHCRVRFEVVSTGVWQSNSAVHSFDEALADFARKVRPGRARVAIGFTSRYDWIQEESHLGGTHGSLASHVLIREQVGRLSEPERLEVLVHELGHFLGAAHSGDQNSVMRPKLGDRRSTAKSFRIGFDAFNTLVINLVAEELRTRHIWHPTMLSPEAKIAVRGAYMVLAKTIPLDPVSKSSVDSLGPLPETGPPGIAGPELVGGAQFVVNAISRAARDNRQLPVSSKDPKAQLWRTGDELTSYYVRRAADAARRLRPDVARSAFLLGLGVALDDTNFVRDKPALADVWKKVEPDEQRQVRLLLMGSPTIHKRHELVEHFAMSAALTVLSGPQGAEAEGRKKEILDSRSGNGFSFADICADMSGVLFATHVREENITLAEVAQGFAVENFVPSLNDLPDDISWDAFQKQYGEGASENFQRQRSEIFHRILALPPYRAGRKEKGGKVHRGTLPSRRPHRRLNAADRPVAAA